MPVMLAVYLSLLTAIQTNASVEEEMLAKEYNSLKKKTITND